MDYRKSSKQRLYLSAKRRRNKGAMYLQNWRKNPRTETSVPIEENSVSTLNTNLPSTSTSSRSTIDDNNNSDMTTSCRPSISEVTESERNSIGDLFCSTPAKDTNEVAPDCQQFRKEITIEGRRILDFGYFFAQLVQLESHGHIFNCRLENMVFVKELRNGSISTFTLKCNMCNFEGTISTADPKLEIDVNTSIVQGITSIGCGYQNMKELFSSLNLPTVSAGNYKGIQERVSDLIEESALSEMNKAADEEKVLAIAAGDVGPDGVPEITVVCDGTWAKRSYRTKYSSLSGAAAIIGFRTRKVLYMGVKNKYCATCARAYNSNKKPTSHRCFKNWTGSSSAMEAAILVDGFRESEGMYGLRYNKFIGDGDSSCYKKLLEAHPYRKIIQKIECRNHLLRNFCTKLRDLSNSAKNGPLHLRRKVSANIMKMRVAVVKAIKYRKIEGTNNYPNLSRDINNIASHIFGEHKKCAELEYFCLKTAPDDDTLVPELIREGLYSKIMDLIRYLSNHSSSLIYDIDSNAVEQFNNVICKHIGGKRINYALGRQYKNRCSASVISYNTKKTAYYSLHKSLCGKSPSQSYKKFELRRIRKRGLKRKRLFHESANQSADYGERCQKPDLSCHEFEEAKSLFLESLKRTSAEIQELEERTRIQGDSVEWRDERRKLLTSSYFGTICKRRQTTKCANLVSSMLYKDIISAAATEYGKQHENTARLELMKQQNIKVIKCGLFIDSEKQFLGASPDGLIGNRGLVEIKCPFSARTMTPEEGIRQKKITFWKINGVTLEVNKNHSWFYQMQGQLHITKREYCILTVWTPLGIKTETILRDDSFWNEIYPKLEKFYFDCLLPELIDPRKSRSLPIREPL